MRLLSRRFEPSEIILILSGLFILVSVFVVYSSGDFKLWVAAKGLYIVGVSLFLFNR